MFKSRDRIARFEMTEEHRRAMAKGKLERERGKGGGRRLLFWVGKVTIILVVIQIFLGGGRDCNLDEGPPVDPSTFYSSEVPLFGDNAPPLNHFKEVEDACFAALNGLAGGSFDAQHKQLEIANQLSLPIEGENSIGMRFRLIPAGEFVMGSPQEEGGRGVMLKTEDYHVEELHVEKVKNPFYVGKFEVTQAEFEEIMGYNPSSYVGPTRPVEELTRIEVERFCKKLTEQENLPKGTYRPLTEVEWEYVCRAGTRTPYSFENIDEIKFYANYGRNSAMTEPVGLRRPNAWGVFNMYGNVMEWCQNRFRGYFKDQKIDSTESRCRNVRGGSWYHVAEDCRSANRCRLADTSKGNMVGFRIVRSLGNELNRIKRLESVNRIVEELTAQSDQ